MWDQVLYQEDVSHQSSHHLRGMYHPPTRHRGGHPLMTERDPYWQHDVAVDLSSLGEWPAIGVRFKVHQSEERFHRGASDELVPLKVPRGSRRYFHGKPYQLEPDYRLTLAVH